MSPKYKVQFSKWLSMIGSDAKHTVCATKAELWWITNHLALNNVYYKAVLDDKNWSQGPPFLYYSRNVE